LLIFPDSLAKLPPRLKKIGQKTRLCRLNRNA